MILLHACHAAVAQGDHSALLLIGVGIAIGIAVSVAAVISEVRQ